MTENLRDPDTRFRSDMWAVIQAIEEARIITVSGQPIIVPGEHIGTLYYPLDAVLKKMAIDEKLITYEIEYKGYYQDINAEYNPGQLVQTDEIGHITVKLLDPAFTDMYKSLSLQFDPNVEAAKGPAVERVAKAAEDDGLAEPNDGIESEAPAAQAIPDDEDDNPAYPLRIAADGLVYYKKRFVKLRPQLHRLCTHLMRNYGRYHSKRSLAVVIYGGEEDDVPENWERTVYTCINELHDILREYFKKDVIQNDTVQGYRFKVPDR